MFKISEDKSIYLTRGDAATLEFNAAIGEEPYVFVKGDVLRFTVYEKKDCGCVVLQKDTIVKNENTSVEVFLGKDDTKIGEPISKPKDYWYEVELNPDTYPQTIIGYDDETGPKVFKLFPEGGDKA